MSQPPENPPPGVESAEVPNGNFYVTMMRVCPWCKRNVEINTDPSAKCPWCHTPMLRKNQ